MPHPEHSSILDAITHLEKTKNRVGQALDKHTAEIIRIWAAAWDDLVEQFEAEYDRIIRLGRNADTLDAYRIQQIYDTLSEIIDEEFSSLIRQLDSRTPAAVKVVTNATIAGLKDAILTQLPTAGAEGLLRPVPRSAMRWITHRATQQITVRHYKLSEEATRAMKRELSAALGAGDNPRTAARHMIQRVEDEFNGGLTRATVIARTEMLDATREAALQQRLENADILAYWIWYADLSSRTCPACWAMHGTQHPIEEWGPIDHHQGRCTALPVTKRAAEAADPDLIPTQEDATRKFEQLPESKQREILGRSRFEAWRRGEYPMDKWPQRIKHYDIIDGQRQQTWRDSTHTSKLPPSSGNPFRSSTPPPRLPAPSPGRTLTQAEKQHFLDRQNALPFKFNGETLKPREVEFAERMHQRGETLEWIPKPPSLPKGKRPSGLDFTWHKDKSLDFELKSPQPKYASIKEHIKEAVLKARNFNVTKENFMIDLGLRPLSQKLRNQLAFYNQRVTDAQIKSLWVLSSDGKSLEEIILR